ncbi:MAG: hypothetical protein Q4E54_00375 [Lachnospiraceae bacterium]|nr:hypothetical protein [Lachnospiraceae bacterium]
MENLKKICDFDTETGIATLHVHYDSVEEIVDSSKGDKDNPWIRDEAIDYINELMSFIPMEFDVRMSVTIDDYQDYDPDNLLEAYETVCRIRGYSEENHNKKKKTIMLCFIPVGLILLFLTVAANKNYLLEYAGPVLKMIAVILLEALFEVYFEEGIVFFTVTQVYRKVISRGDSRFKGIILQSGKL